MEHKNYLLLARSNDGFIHEKVSISCGLDMAVNVCRMVMTTSPRLVRGEVIEGNRTHIGDFSVRPLVFIYRDGESFSEQTERQ